MHHLKHLMHLGLGFAHTQPADAVAGEIQPRQKFGALGAQVGKDAPLDDAVQRLVRAGLGDFTALGPAVGSFQGFDVVLIVVGRGTFVKSHDDVRSQLLLDADHNFRGKTMIRAVNVGAKGDTVVVYLAQPFQAEDLEAAGVGQNGPGPLHKMVQPTEIGDQVGAGPQVEVVSVAQDERRSQRLQIGGRQRFDRRLRADRRKHRRGDVAVRGVDDSRAGGGVLVFDEKFE